MTNAAVPLKGHVDGLPEGGAHLTRNDLARLMVALRAVINRTRTRRAQPFPHRGETVSMAARRFLAAGHDDVDRPDVRAIDATISLLQTIRRDLEIPAT